MTVETWFGKKPDNSAEQQVLIELYDFLASQAEHYVIMANFHCGAGPETDLMVLKQKGFFIAELKRAPDKLIGGKNGESWTFIRADGSQGQMRNPYLQVRNCCFKWKEWIRDHKEAIERVAGRKHDLREFEPSEYILVYPDSNPDNQVDIGDFPVQLMGLRTFQVALTVKTQRGADFTRAEMQAIPKKLNLMPLMPADRTVPLNAAAQPVRVQMLVARSHALSDVVFYLDKECIKIGRDPKNDLVIQDAHVSREHAELVRAGDRWVVRDQESDNGTWVCFNGDPRTERRVNKENAVKNGSIIRFGNASYTVLLDDPSR